MHLHEFAVVHDAADHVEHVVRLAVVVRHDGGKSLGHVTVGAGCGVRVGGRLQVGVGRQVGEHGSCVVDRVGFVFAQVVRYTGGGVVHISAAEVVHADHFACGRFDHVRTGDEHVGVFTGHDDQIGQCRAVHGSTRAWAENQRELRHETAGVAGFTEQMPVLRQRGHALLNAGTARIDKRDDRHFQVERFVHQSADLAAFRDSQRAAAHGKVLCVYGHFASEHFAETGDDRRSRASAVDVAAAESSDFLEGTGVKQQVKTFARRQFAFDMLAIAGMIFRFVRELRRTKHGCADWLGCARQVGRGDGFGRVFAESLLLLHYDLHGFFDGRACDDISHHLPPSIVPSVAVPSTAAPVAPFSPAFVPFAPVTSMVINVSPASTPAAGPTKILVTAPLTGAYT